MLKPARLFSAMQPTVFLGSACLVLGFVGLGVGWPDLAQRVFQAIQSGIIEHFGWLYVLGASALLVFVLVILFSRFRDIRLGGLDAEPEFSYLSWFAMMFSAGMGTGLVYWGVAEPMMHWTEPPFAPASGEGEIRQAMRLSFFHWGLHPWGVYIVFGLSLAYFHFRHDLPLAPRSLLYPVIGQRIYGPIGHAVDILATVGTLFGVATSLGLGAMQINAGIARLVDIPQGEMVQVAIIALITLVATISVVSGVHKGIRRLSQLNIALAALLLAFVFVAGPTVHLLEILISATGDYLQHLLGMSLWLDLRADSHWQADWTLFYWSWWISWSPFVGVFVARISRGRTIGEFILAVLLVPVLVTFVWLAVFGGTGLSQEVSGASRIAESVSENPSDGLYAMLQQLPLPTVTAVLATLLVVIFFVTSSDSGSLVDDMVTSGGHPNPPRAQRVFWAVSEGTVAATLLLSGGLQALRTASLTSGLPMTVFLLIAAWGLLKALRVDAAEDGIPERTALRRGLERSD
ncbi:BCCT family transporter [Thiococcus pfennigii]|uniref:BCCT family transporter n=1 Tax=Thiococcus pfennigii TaxID=1057 RepID=UPI00190823F2|nr:BCCT family transporter [Thiococcus pfennigii]MBK1731856.1 choline transporter [Thiococcus pfennigii]